MTPTTALTFSFFLLLGNAFFVGAEFAVMAARRSRLEPMADAGSKRALLCLEAFEQVASLLACAQLGITVCSVLLGAVAEDALHHLIAPVLSAIGVPDVWGHPIALALALLIVAYLHVVLGEMVPKNLAIAGPDTAALFLAPVLLYLTRALRPLIKVMEFIAKSVVRLMRIEPRDEIASTFTAQEVHELVHESAREGLIEAGQEGLTSRVIEFSDRVAADVAVPVGHLVTVAHEATPADVERLVAKQGYSRFPLRARGTGDDPGPATSLDGYIHVKDVLYADGADRHEPIPEKRVRRLATVAPQDEVEDVLESMQHSGSHLARVVGPDGAVTGVVFLEDVLEELVGEVLDASQRGDNPIAGRGPSTPDRGEPGEGS